MIDTAVNLHDELQRTQTWMSALLAQLPDVVLYETGGGREYISENVRGMLGYTAEQITSQRGFFPSRMHPEDDPRCAEMMHNWRESGFPGVLNIQFRFKRSDGVYIWIEDHIKLVEHQGEKPSMVGVLIDITERIRSEEALRQSHRLFDTFMRELPGIAFIQDVAGNQIYSNRPEHPALEVIAKSIVESQREERMIELSQSESWCVRSFPLPDGRTGAIAFDVSTEQLAKEALRKSESSLKSILQTTPDLIVTISTAGRILFANHQVLNGFGYSESELVGADIFEMIHPSDIPTVQRSFQTTLDFGASEMKTIRIQNHAGEWRYVELTSRLLHDGTGGIEGVLTVGRDITQRVLAEQLAEEREMRHQSILQAADETGVGLAIVKLDGKNVGVRFINEAGAAICGGTVESLTGTTILPLIEESQRSYYEDRSVLNSSTDDFIRDSFALPLKLPSGEIRYIFGGYTVSTVDGERISIVIFHDVTERHRMQEELRIAERRAADLSRVKSTLLANFSHELRTPMNSILGFSSLMVEELENSPVKTYAESIQRSGKRLLSTLHSVLELVNIESDETQLTLEPIRLDFILRHLEEQYREPIEAKGIAFEVIAELPNINAHADRSRLLLALGHLVSNALKFTSQGVIELRLSCRSEHNGEGAAILEIRDTGIGMSKEFVDRAFEVFEQESKGWSRQFEGTGLGLTIARNYIRLMDGKIMIQSTRGVGTTVRVELPLAAEPYIAREARMTVS